MVVSHEKYRNLHRQAVRREQVRAAKQRQREREKAGESAPEYEGPSPEETAAVFKDDGEPKPVSPEPKKDPKPKPKEPPEKDPDVERLLQQGAPPPEPLDDRWL
jgi:hypothetical protein